MYSTVLKLMQEYENKNDVRLTLMIYSDGRVAFYIEGEGYYGDEYQDTFKNLGVLKTWLEEEVSQ